MGDQILKWNRTKNIKLCQSRLKVLIPYQNQKRDTWIRSNHPNNLKFPLPLFYSTELLHNTGLEKYKENDVVQENICSNIAPNSALPESWQQSSTRKYKSGRLFIFNLVFSALIPPDQTEMFHSGKLRGPYCHFDTLNRQNIMQFAKLCSPSQAYF